MEESSTEVVIDTELQIGRHIYTSKWTVTSSQYEILLGMQWHSETDPIVNWETKWVFVMDTILFNATSDVVKIYLLGVKMFCLLLKGNQKHESSLFVYYILNVSTSFQQDGSELSFQKCSGDNLLELMTEFSLVFREYLLAGLPPEQDVDHKTEIEPGLKPPHR